MVFCSFSGDFRKMVDVNYVCAMGPPGGGRNPVTARLMRHFNFLAFTELEDTSKIKIFRTILEAWMCKYIKMLVTCSCIVNTLLQYKLKLYDIPTEIFNKEQCCAMRFRQVQKWLCCRP